MESAVPALVSAAVTICGIQTAGTISAVQVCDSKKVSDHHAVVPTNSAVTADLSALPLEEHEILRLVSLALVRAVCPPHRYAETSLTAECGGHRFTAKGKTVLDIGWRTCAALPKDAALHRLQFRAIIQVSHQDYLVHRNHFRVSQLIICQGGGGHAEQLSSTFAAG